MLPGALLFIFPLIMLLATMFPGLRLHLLCAAHRTACRLRVLLQRQALMEDVRTTLLDTPPELNGIKSEQDALTPMCCCFTQIADEIGIDSDLRPSSTDMFFAVYT